MVGQRTTHPGGGEVGEREDGVRRAAGMAVASVACGVLATGWVRPFGYYTAYPAGAIAAALTGLGVVSLASVPAGRLADSYFRSRQGGAFWRGLLGWCGGIIVVAVVLTAVAVAAIREWIGAMGEYAVPRAPDSIGVVLSLCAVGLGIWSFRVARPARTTAVAGILLGLLVLVTAFAWDIVVDSPYRAVRRFAAAAARADQDAMIAQFSAESVRHFDELPVAHYGVGGRSGELVTVDHMHPPAARETLLLSVEREGHRATVECVVPITRSATGGRFGHGGQIHLIREGGAWRIDAYRHWQEPRERWEERAPDQQRAGGPRTPRSADAEPAPAGSG
jgi:hypothetical protein